jgi:hypothetical protein
MVDSSVLLGGAVLATQLLQRASDFFTSRNHFIHQRFFGLLDLIELAGKLRLLRLRGAVPQLQQRIMPGLRCRFRLAPVLTANGVPQAGVLAAEQLDADVLIH